LTQFLSGTSEVPANTDGEDPVAEPNARDTKLIQYLNEAYGKERELETALDAHISMTTRMPYKKRLRQHLTETKGHARQLERRIKQLGGQPTTLGATAKKAAALAKGPLHMLRGSGEAEKQLKNAKTQYFNEAEEIATYTAIEALAETVGDKDTAKLARAIRREEERMSGYLEKLIPTLTRAVAQEEIPAAERRNGGSRTTRRRRTSSASASRNGSGSRSTTSRTRARSGSRTRSRSGARS
jgi:ferritin-like metal-binding protein YciE